LVSQGAKASSRAHKEAILKEFKRKEEQEKLRLRQQKEKEEATAARKKKRAALREQDRLEKLGAKIQANIIGVAQQEEYTQRMQVFDVRDYNNK